MPSTRCVIVMYHYVRDLKYSRYPEIKGLDMPLFIQQLDFLTERYTIITMEQLLDALRGGTPLPNDAALLTFDDGYADHYTNVFPQLYRRGLQGSFFVPAAVVAERRVLDVNKIHYVLASAPEERVLKEVYALLDEYRKEGRVTESNEALHARLVTQSRYDTPGVVFIKSLLQHGLPATLRAEMVSRLFERVVGISETALANELYVTYDQVQLMKRCGMYFGLHGYDHMWLGKTEESVMQKDVDRALDFWAGVIDTDCWAMNYPYGDYSDAVKRCIGARGCRIGLSTVVAAADIATDDPLALPRLDTNDFPPKSDGYVGLGV